MERIYVGKICPYCKTPIQEEEVVVFCNSCSMPHHLACWQANQGCTTYGCSGTIEAIINQENAYKSGAQRAPENTVRQTYPAPMTDSRAAGENRTSGEAANYTDRYETIFEQNEGKLQEDSPVLIEKVSLIKDTVEDAIYARCSFRSLTDDSIKAILLDIKGADVWGNAAEGVEGFQLLDLKTKRETVFGQNTPIPIPNRNVREIEVIIRKILYEDRRMVDCKEAFSKVPMQQTLVSALGGSEYERYYAELTTKEAKYVPAVSEKIWRCTCGATNPAGEVTCYHCKTDLMSQWECYQPEKIIAETNAFLEEKRRKEEEFRRRREREQWEAEERFRRAQEEKERREREELAAKAEKKRKRRKRVLVSVFSVIFLVGTIYGAGWHLIPFVRYSMAGSNVEKCNFDAAYKTYIALGNYRDCPDKAIETIYAKAAHLEGEERFREAMAEYEKIPDYKDSQDKVAECKNAADYHDAKAKYDAKEYEEAVTLFTELGEYADSKDWILKTKYTWAKDSLEKEEYAKSVDLWVELNNYEDSKEQLKEARYQMAEAAYREKDYKTAYENYELLLVYDFKESREKVKDAKYLYAENCMADGKYQDASDAYASLRDYLDSQDKFKKATYIYMRKIVMKRKIMKMPVLILQK